MIRSILGFLAGATLVVISGSNIWRFNENISHLPSRDADTMVHWESRLSSIQGALIRARYRTGDIGYMPAGILKGNPMTVEEDTNWVEARYVMIPLNLKQNTLAAPFVILDSTGSPTPPEIPAGFVKVFDAENGLILLQRQSTP